MNFHQVEKEVKKSSLSTPAGREKRGDRQKKGKQLGLHVLVRSAQTEIQGQAWGDSEAQRQVTTHTHGEAAPARMRQEEAWVRAPEPSMALYSGSGAQRRRHADRDTEVLPSRQKPEDLDETWGGAKLSTDGNTKARVQRSPVGGAYRHKEPKDPPRPGPRPHP